MAGFFKSRKIRVALLVMTLFTGLFILLFSFFVYSRSNVDRTIAQRASAVDLNPEISSDENILGKWSGKNEQIVLAADGTFNYHFSNHTEIGTWRRNDWNLHLKGKGYSAEMRFVKFHKQYLLLTNPPDFSQYDSGKGRVDAISSALRRAHE